MWSANSLGQTQHSNLDTSAIFGAIGAYTVVLPPSWGVLSIQCYPCHHILLLAVLRRSSSPFVFTVHFLGCLWDFWRDQIRDKDISPVVIQQTWDSKLQSYSPPLLGQHKRCTSDNGISTMPLELLATLATSRCWPTGIIRFHAKASFEIVAFVLTPFCKTMCYRILAQEWAQNGTNTFKILPARKGSEWEQHLCSDKPQHKFQTKECSVVGVHL